MVPIEDEVLRAHVRIGDTVCVVRVEMRSGKVQRWNEIERGDKRVA